MVTMTIMMIIKDNEYNNSNYIDNEYRMPVMIPDSKTIRLIGIVKKVRS